MLVTFVADILLAGHEARQPWLDFVGAQPTAPIRWATQVGVRHRQGGIADLLLLVDGKEAIIVENRIGAVVRRHEEDAAEFSSLEAAAGPLLDVPVADANQLRTYGKWLASRSTGRRWPGALVLLTHYSAPPADFGGPTPGDYGVPNLQVCRWGMIWRWSKTMGAHAFAGDTAGKLTGWIVLCREFTEFLENENMTSDSMTLHDVATAEVFVSSAQRIERTFAIVREALEPTKNALGHNTGRIPPHPTYEDGLVWTWFYFLQPQKIKNNWHFGWGIRFPELSKWALDCSPPLPLVAHAFVTLSADNEDFPSTSLKPTDILPGWRITPNEEDLVVAKPLHELRPDAEGLAADFSEWVAASIKSARPMLEKLVKALD